MRLVQLFQLMETQAQGLNHLSRMGSRTEPTPSQLADFALEVGLHRHLAWWGGRGGVAMAGVSHLDQFRSRPRGPRRHLKGHWQAGQGWPSWRVGGPDQRRGRGRSDPEAHLPTRSQGPGARRQMVAGGGSYHRGLCRGLLWPSLGWGHAPPILLLPIVTSEPPPAPTADWRNRGGS